MASENPIYKCKRGWLISMDEEGGYVPFFIRVRADDITWTTKATDLFFKNIELSLKSFGYDYTAGIKTPNVEFEVISGNWTYHILPNGKVRAKYVGAVPVNEFKVLKTHISNDDTITAGANVKIDLPISLKKESAMIVGNMEPVGACYTYIKGARHKSYSPNKVYDTIDVNLRCTYDLDVVSEFNAQAIDDMIASGEGPVLSIYIEGEIQL